MSTSSLGDVRNLLCIQIIIGLPNVLLHYVCVKLFRSEYDTDIGVSDKQTDTMFLSYYVKVNSYHSIHCIS